MADAFPSNILDNVLEQLELSIFQSTKLNFLQRIQVRDLRSKLELIKCVIDDAEQIAVLFPDVVGKWVRDLQRVLYEIDDLLDEVVTRSLPSSGVLKKVHLRLRLYSLPLDLTVAPKLKNFNKRLDSIVKECYKCNLLVKPARSTSIVGGGVEKSVAWEGILRSNPNDPNVDHCKMIGRDDDKKKIIQMLFDEDHLAAPFICIRGKGGVGKTTLCRAIYNDEDVGKHFDRQMWADFKSLGDSIVRHEIVSLIERKEKTLIVLDNFVKDCKNHNLRNHLNDVRSLIATSDKGNKILITSSHLLPSSDISFSQDALINDLPGEHCWSIFENTVFVDGHDKKEWMEALGKDIANKCLGNPFLVRAVGTLLYQNNDEALWGYFSRDFDFKRSHQRYIVISRLSQLFPKFQQPVGYLTLFTKDVPTQRDLISQFAAHGFTNFSIKVKKFFFGGRKIEEDHWDETPRYVIDRMHEPIITMLPGSEAVFLGGMETGCDEKARHVAIDRLSSSAAQQRDIILPRSLTNDVVHKRSLLFPKELSPIRMSVETLDMLTSKLLYLRVLDLHDLALKALPGSFGKLIHLRYVDLSRNEFKMLPESIGRLKNLQTLKLTYCDKLVKLPQCIKSLHQLKRLELNMCFDLIGMPSAIAVMTSLETLDRYVVGPHSSGLRYLKHVNNLCGSLSIELPQQWKQYTIEDAEQANLESKKELISVEFKWSGGACSGDDENVNEAVFEKLKPCAKIKYLYIVNFGGKTFPSWITSLGMMNRLSHIVISHCRGCKILPPFHMMPRLRCLRLASMDIEYLQDGGLSADTVFFPSLSELKIGRMPKLIRWSRDMSSLLLRFSDIKNVEIWDCPRLAVMPPFSNIEHQLVLQDIPKKTLQVIDWEINRYIEIVSITDMVSLSEEFITRLPRALKVEYCHDWQMFSANEVEQTPTSKPLLEGFQRLVRLSIANCRAMKYLSSSLRHLINLEWLEISKCSEELDCFYEEDEGGMPWKALQRLRFLKIRGFDKLVSLPRALQHLPCPLSQLGIVDCKSLKSCFHFSETGELFEVFGGLEGLSIDNCSEIKYVSSGLRHLHRLRHLEISKCSEELDCLCDVNEDGMPWKALRVLQSLKIEGFENLVALPNGLQHLTSLLKLEIRDCKTLEGELPVLLRLRILYLESCPRFSKEHGREHPYHTVVEEKMKSRLFQGFDFSCPGCNKFHPVGGADVGVAESSHQVGNSRNGAGGHVCEQSLEQPNLQLNSEMRLPRPKCILSLLLGCMVELPED